MCQQLPSYTSSRLTAEIRFRLCSRSPVQGFTLLFIPDLVSTRETFGSVLQLLDVSAVLIIECLTLCHCAVSCWACKPWCVYHQKQLSAAAGSHVTQLNRAEPQKQNCLKNLGRADGNCIVLSTPARLISSHLLYSVIFLITTTRLAAHVQILISDALANTSAVSVLFSQCIIQIVLKEGNEIRYEIKRDWIAAAVEMCWQW